MAIDLSAFLFKISLLDSATSRLLELAANQLSTSRSAEREISTTTDWGLLKQPDNQKPAKILNRCLN